MPLKRKPGESAGEFEARRLVEEAFKKETEEIPQTYETPRIYEKPDKKTQTKRRELSERLKGTNDQFRF